MKQDGAGLLIEAGDDYVMEPSSGRRKAHDQGPPLRDMVLEVAPLTADGEGMKARLLEVGAHRGAWNSAFGGDIEFALNAGGIGFRQFSATQCAPVAHDHGETRGPASVLLLPDEGHIQAQAPGRESGRQKYGNQGRGLHERVQLTAMSTMTAVHRAMTM
jgi:hypothetical protein